MSLKDLLKKEFDVSIETYDLSSISPEVYLKANILVEELEVENIPFEDGEFDKIYDHIYYLDLKYILEIFSHIRNLKLPAKDFIRK